ncbi:MAG: hypothetical protein RL434_1511, partial [Pseudomonadota bacterium]
MSDLTKLNWHAYAGLEFFQEVIAGRQPQAPMNESVPFRPV